MVKESTIAMLSPPVNHGGIGHYSEQLRTCVADAGVDNVQIDFFENLSFAGYVRAAERATNYDVAHVQFEYGFVRPKLVYAWLFFPVLFISSRLRGTPVIITMHEVWTAEKVGRTKFSYVWLVHVILALTATRLVFMSDVAAEDFRPNGLASIENIPHGVDLEGVCEVDRKQARDTFGYEVDDTVVSQIGYVSRRKGTDTFLQMATSNDEYEFLIAGGPFRDEDELYFNKVVESAPENTQVTGILSEDEFHDAFVATDIAVLAYRDIRQSGILNWCFAYGVPVVCRAIDRFENLADQGAPLILFDQEDEDYPSINEAVNIGLKERDSRSAGMRAYGEEHDLSRVAHRYISLYRSLVRV